MAKVLDLVVFSKMIFYSIRNISYSLEKCYFVDVLIPFKIIVMSKSIY